MIKKKQITEFLKYALVGFIGIFVNILFLYIFTEFFQVYYLISAVFSFIIATFHNFILNKIWTFKENFREKLFIKGGKFFAVAGISLLANIFLLYFFTEVIGIYYLFSQILTSGFTFIINFSGNKFWTFKKSQFYR